ncbi:unnamed protein product, partial [Rotaria socialis]
QIVWMDTHHCYKENT